MADAPPAYHEAFGNEAPPPAFSEMPPAFEEYDSPPKSGINFVKDDTPPPFEEPSRSTSQATTSSNGETQVVVLNTTANTAEIFHLISILCAVLSLLVFPLIELIPAIMYCLITKENLRNDKPNALMLHQLDFLVTAICFAIAFAFILVIGIFTFGIGLIFLVFLIPFVVVLVELSTFTPQTGQGIY